MLLVRASRGAQHQCSKAGRECLFRIAHDSGKGEENAPWIAQAFTTRCSAWLVFVWMAGPMRAGSAG